jgi:hypothetical protein
MQYMVIVKVKHPRVGWVHLREYLLDGLVPDRVIELMKCKVVERDLDLCSICDVQGRRSHVMLWIAPRNTAPYCGMTFLSRPAGRLRISFEGEYDYM